MNQPTKLGSTTVVTSQAISLPTNITPAEREKLLDFHRDNQRWPEESDGEMYVLLKRANAETATAMATAPRQPGESESSYVWRKQSGERALTTRGTKSTASVASAPASRRRRPIVGARVRVGAPALSSRVAAPTAATLHHYRLS